MVVPGRLRLALAVTALCALLPLTAPAGASAAAKGFKFGVSSGDVSAGSAILWARANKSGKALVQVKLGGRWDPCDIAEAPKKMVVKAVKSNDFTVQAKVGGLKAGRTYAYAHRAGRELSAAARDLVTLLGDGG